MTRTAILSDIHGNLTALEAVLEDVGDQNVDRIAAIDEIVELNIGHSIIARAVFDGIEEAVAEMKRRMLGARRR